MSQLLAKSIRTKIREAILYRLNLINKSNGFNTNIGDVYDEPRAIDSIKNFPAVLVDVGQHECVNASEGTITQGFRLDYKGNYTFKCILKESDDTELTREYLIADIQKVFMQNSRSVIGKDGTATAIESMFGNDRPWGTESNKPLIGHEIEFWVRYQQKLDDPTLRP